MDFFLFFTSILFGVIMSLREGEKKDGEKGNCIIVKPKLPSYSAMLGKKICYSTNSLFLSSNHFWIYTFNSPTHPFPFFFFFFWFGSFSTRCKWMKFQIFSQRKKPMPLQGWNWMTSFSFILFTIFWNCVDFKRYSIYWKLSRAPDKFAYIYIYIYIYI